MRPHVVCLMQTSLDGRLHPSRFTKSPQGGPKDWSKAYEATHDALDGDAWLVGRTTMAEMSKAGPHPPHEAGQVARPHHFPVREADNFALAVDRHARLHFDAGGKVGGDPAVVLLGRGTPDSHLAELAADGVGYVVAEDEDFRLAPLLETLARELSVRRLLLEGGGVVNGGFLAERLVDEIVLLVAPAIDGGVGADGVFAHGEAGLAGKVELSLTSATVRDHGLVELRYSVAPARPA